MNGFMRLEQFLWRHYVAWSRRRRLLFPSPAEVGLMRLMGARAIRVKWLRDPFGQHYCLTIVVRKSKLFRHQNVRREVECAGFFMDFANDIGRAIEVDGAAYHMDIVAEREREHVLLEHGFRVLRVRASDLVQRPAWVRDRVYGFLDG